MKPAVIIGLDLDNAIFRLPEHRLWAAVLHLAILDAEPWIKNLEYKNYDQVHYGKRAMNWLESESAHEGGFRWVCDMLDLEPCAVRSYIGLTKNIW